MTTKEKLIALLESRPGEWLSGEELAEKLSVSRTAVWKAVNSLRSIGYEINAGQNKGYCLSAGSDVVSEQGIRRYLKPVCDGLCISVQPTARSTNAELREMAMANTPEGFVLIANAQSHGRGRLGHSFYSPPDTGIYLSLLLRPADYTPEQTVRLTTMAAVAACQAIESVTCREASIKWVNDIFMDGRKVCGILTEASFDLESGHPEYVVLGIGINAYLPDGGFPPEIANIAGAVYPEREKDGKNRLAAEFLNKFLSWYYEIESGSYAEIYRRKSLVIGREVTVISASGKRNAFALDVDGSCRLVVRYKDGSIAALSSAEVSVKI